MSRAFAIQYPLDTAKERLRGAELLEENPRLHQSVVFFTTSQAAPQLLELLLDGFQVILIAIDAEDGHLAVIVRSDRRVDMAQEWFLACQR